MRILYLVADLFGPPGGIPRYCRIICRALSETRADLTVLTLMDETMAGREARKTFPLIHYSTCSGNRLRFLQRAFRAARTRPDVILVGHVHFAPLGWLLSKLLRVPFTTFVYGVDAWEPLSPVRRRALCASDQIISISRFTAHRAALVNGICPQSVRLLPNCVDPKLIADQALKPASSPLLSLLTVSRILGSRMGKGHDQVIRALPSLLQRFPNLIYNVVGGGEGRSEMEALALKEGVSHAVRFHGVVSDEEMAGCYASADVFIMPSQREGFGFVFIEAMAQGIPAIGGNKDATPEVIVDGETGYIVDPTSVDAIVDVTARLLSDPNLRQRMGHKALTHVEKEFGFAKFKKALLSHLAELCDFSDRGKRY
jgi:phosphatidylinositol alpha-1,6-mannosyltransferase